MIKEEWTYKTVIYAYMSLISIRVGKATESLEDIVLGTEDCLALFGDLCC